MLIELSLDTSDTSVITRRLILPSVSTTGVKLSEMPNFLKAIDGEHCPTAPAGFVWHVTPVGKGNSPPTMNVADSPEMAVRLGSASVRTTPALSIARRVAVTVGTPALFKADVVSELAVIGPLLAVNGLLLLKFTTAVPTFMLALRSTPNCLMMLRCTSATVTFNIT